MFLLISPPSTIIDDTYDAPLGLCYLGAMLLKYNFKVIGLDCGRDLLNLILSCLASIQAPIIMMSQNRQEVKDRLRAENDYKINLKAEYEIRALQEKVDQMFKLLNSIQNH